MNVNLGLFGSKARIPVLIQPAQLERNGMEAVAFPFFALLIHFIMDLNVFVQLLKINVNHGNTMMDKSVFIFLKNAH